MQYDVLLLETEGRIDTALLEDGRLVEYWPVSLKEELAPGQIYLGQILRRVPGLSAAFVDIGLSKPAFLPLDGRSLEDFPPGRELPVQVQKLPVGNKGAAVTDQLSFAGRYVVLTPADSRISVSGKITGTEERRRLKEAGERFPMAGEYGYILRTEAEGCSEAFLMEEASSLCQYTKGLLQRAQHASVGKCLSQSPCPWLEPIRLLPADSIRRVLTDSRFCLDYLKDHIDMLAISLDQLQWYEDARWSLSDFYKIGSQLHKAGEKQVFLPQDGGYLFIEETEAMVVIDVNSALTISGREKEDAVFALNSRAAEELMSQIRLRNLSGIIMVDFVNMNSARHQEKLLQLLRETAKKDRQKVTVYGFTQLGLVEMTRERKGLSLSHYRL